MAIRGRVCSLACVTVLMLQGLGLCTSASAAPEAAGQPAAAAGAIEPADYTQYLEAHAEANRPRLADALGIPAGRYSGIDPAGSAEVLAYAGRRDALLIQSSLRYVEYQVSVPETGLYNLAAVHHPLDTDAKRYEIGLSLDGEIPFTQAGSLFLANTYRPESDEILTDGSGDQFAPNREVVRDWTSNRLQNPDGNYDEPLCFYLTAGDHTLRLSFSAPDAFVLGELQLCAIEQPPTYTDYRQQHAGDAAGDARQIIEAEDAGRQSDSTLRPTSDRTDRMTSPYSAKNRLMNIIGNSWSAHGQWLEWTVDIEETGYYRLSFRYQQEDLKGLAVGRRLTIDGAVPFAEAACLPFPYTSHWDLLTAADQAGEPYLFYLTAGRHTLRLEAVLGELAPIVRELDEVIYRLNQLYRNIIMITTTTADPYRDYNLDKEIPGLMDDLRASAAGLRRHYDAISAIAQGSAAECAILMTTARQLESFLDKPRTIPQRLTSFQSNIGSLSAWVLDIRSQPLMLDYFVLSKQDAVLPRARGNLWDSIVHSTSLFLNSFVQDYNSFAAGEGGQSISLWLGTGRDQAEVLWRMTADLFTPQSGISVDIKLVSASMVEAFLSGNAPDVAINAARDLPVNLAIRSALLDLSSFADFPEVTDWFQPGALTPYTFQNSVYGLPDTQIFNMLFYRRDIFEELRLEVPQTWDDFIRVANQLHLFKLDAGIPVNSATAGDASMFYTLLQQGGGQLFTADLARTQLDSAASQAAFARWTDLYTKVGLPVTYDFFNRFRSGEMPMAVVPYTMYNQLTSAAPELRGLWEMTAIPGTERADGTIDRSQPATGTAAVILSTTPHPDAAWQFIKWWVGSEAQARYANDLESKIGVIGRVAVANKEAFAALDWPPRLLSLLSEQWQLVQEIPQVPGNYYLDRDLINAFRDVVYNGRNTREAIQEYGRRINGEIARKREEFGLE